MTVALKTLFTKRIILFISLGLIAFMLYFSYFVGVIGVIDLIKRANLLYYMAAFIAFLVAVFFSSLTWHSLLSSLSVKTSVRRVLLFMWVGMFFDVTVPEPGWSGDLLKVYMLAKTSGQESGRNCGFGCGSKSYWHGGYHRRPDFGIGSSGLELRFAKPGSHLCCYRLVSFNFLIVHSGLLKR